jgi:lactate racemase
MLQPYGETEQSGREPDGWRVRPVTLHATTVACSEYSTIHSALDNPVDAPHLRDFVLPGERVVILLPDKTRVCGAGQYLPELLNTLAARGIRDNDITLFFACGTHTAQSESERRAIVGDVLYERFRIEENASHDEASYVHVGTTAMGTPVQLHRTVASADKVIATGTIVHHYFAGYGGGPKLFMPGSASYLTAITNHRRTLTPDGHFHTGCQDGTLIGNPVAEDIFDAIRFFPPSWYFAALIDAEGRIARAVAGDLLSAHRQGCRMIDDMYRVEVNQRADVTIVSAGFHPKDINFIQAHKALHRASRVTKPGGCIVFLADCRDGIGNDAFLSWFDIASDAEFRRAILDRYSMNAHTALAMREKARDFSIFFVTGLDPASVQRMGMTWCASLDDALQRVAQQYGPSPLVYTIPFGSLVLPTLTASR